MTKAKGTPARVTKPAEPKFGFTKASKPGEWDRVFGMRKRLRMTDGSIVHARVGQRYRQVGTYQPEPRTRLRGRPIPAAEPAYEVEGKLVPDEPSSSSKPASDRKTVQHTPETDPRIKAEMERLDAEEGSDAKLG